MEFKKGDFVKLLNEKEIYIIDDIKDNEVCIKGLDNETIMDLTELSIEEIELIRKEMSLN